MNIRSIRIGVVASLVLAASAMAQPKVTITLPKSKAGAPQLGRLMFLISADPKDEPRNQIDFHSTTQQAFGVDVHNWAPGTTRTIGADAYGYPVRGLKDIPKGTYRVQALLNRYEVFHLADGRTLELPPDHWEGQHWNSKPGNFYSKPVEVKWTGSGAINLELDQEIPPVDDFAKQETKYVKYVRIRSEKLSAFWGRDVELGAWVLLPEGFDAHPNAHYPVVISHGHFPSRPTGWRETPPDPNAKPVYSDRFHIEAYNRIEDQAAYDFYKEWTGPKFPRVLLVELQHPTPYYDDSYAVNSVNNGPYGDAIQRELLPEIEKRFRGIGAGWARFVFGGSTGGWESLAVQLEYPDEYNGAWIACPDPIDFHQYMVVDIYKDANAYFVPSTWQHTARPAHRNYLGQVDATLEQNGHYELVLGTHGRSGEQLDIWESVYGPVGPDGYPARLWDKETGAIDSKVAKQWEAYDLLAKLKRNWASMAPRLKGKLRLYVGESDNYFLNNAVHTTEDFVKQATPGIEAVFDYGARDEHCWNGDHTRPNAYSRLRYPQMVLPWMVERAVSTAPKGADVTSWRY